MVSGIYKITNKINNHFYIGQSKNIEKRWKDHIKTAKENKNRTVLQKAFCKYGVDNFTSMTISVTNVQTAYSFTVSVVGVKSDGTKTTIISKSWNTSSLPSTTKDISSFTTINVSINQTSSQRPAKRYNISFS